MGKTRKVTVDAHTELLHGMQYGVLFKNGVGETTTDNQYLDMLRNLGYEVLTHALEDKVEVTPTEGDVAAVVAAAEVIPVTRKKRGKSKPKAKVE
jgi:hypothetical protein